ncbi:MAG TPA: MBL fold metallo-hydrolase [Anaerolineae bacterium]|nr:MBL fold metallo-hydrolase [Anaerolineae bacterium]
MGVDAALTPTYTSPPLAVDLLQWIHLLIQLSGGRMRFGDLEIDLVSDGVVWLDAGGPFGLVPRELFQRVFPLRSDNTVPMSLTCMLVRSRGKTILVDTGLGTKLKPEERGRWRLERADGDLLKALAKIGISAEEIDIVINTHLHADHCGGNTTREGDAIVATFPRAEYWVQRIEWAEAYHPDERTRGTYFHKNYVPLMEEGRLRLLHGNTEVTDQVECIVTPGHTRGHQSVRLRADSWDGLYLGDMATYAVHFAHTSWLTAYDVLPLENVETKKRWQHWALKKRAWLFLEHDPLMPVVHLVERDGRKDILPIEAAQPLIDPLPRQLQPLE